METKKNVEDVEVKKSQIERSVDLLRAISVYQKYFPAVSTEASIFNLINEYRKIDQDFDFDYLMNEYKLTPLSCLIKANLDSQIVNLIHHLIDKEIARKEKAEKKDKKK